MNKLTVLEFFTRGIPEAFLFIFAAYAFSNNLLDKKKWILSSLIMAVIGFISRSLPIHYGVHTILNVFAFIIIVSNINKIDLIKSIQIGIFTVIIQFICEAANVFLIQYIFRADIGKIFKDPTLKTVYGIPSTVLFAGIVILYYFKISKRKEKKKIDGKISA